MLRVSLAREGTSQEEDGLAKGLAARKGFREKLAKPRPLRRRDGGKEGDLSQKPQRRYSEVM